MSTNKRKAVFLSLIFERLPEGQASRWWMARAYSNWWTMTTLMVIWPLNYVVSFTFWLGHRWDHYRMKPSWIDEMVREAVRKSEAEDARRFIRRMLYK